MLEREFSLVVITVGITEGLAQVVITPHLTVMQRVQILLKISSESFYYKVWELWRIRLGRLNFELTGVWYRYNYRVSIGTNISELRGQGQHKNKQF